VVFRFFRRRKFEALIFGEERKIRVGPHYSAASVSSSVSSSLRAESAISIVYSPLI
jgi:hypothetical protein